MAESKALTVSEAMGMAKGALEGISVRLIGEVSEVSNKPGYKAVYFTVKDEHAALPCMMWNNRYRAAGVDLQVGMLVELAGRFTLYAAKGRMNFDVSSVSPAGEGVLRMQVAALARQLQLEGLMNPERKRALPALPETIGLVTSPRGAVVHDVLRTLRRRYPLVRVLIAGVPVEGATAARGLIEGLNTVVAAGAEVVLIVRGGGSFEDFMPFNDEALARAVASAPVPVVTGIGHEPDTTIVDMVADKRASTPTAAAEAVAPDSASLRAHLRSCATSLAHTMRSRLDVSQRNLERIALIPLFKEPQRLFEGEALALDGLADRLGRALPQALAEDKRNLELLRLSLANMLPHAVSDDSRHALSLQSRLCYQGDVLTSRFAHELSTAAAQLNSLSPLATVARGYAIARDCEGRIVKSIQGLDKGAPLSVTVADGVVNCTVEDTEYVETSVESWEE